MNNNKKQAEADLDKSSNHFHRLNSTHLFHVGKQMSRTILKNDGLWQLFDNVSEPSVIISSLSVQ